MNKLLRTCTNFLTGRLRSFAKDRRGNFGVMLAISAVPLVGLSGLALDYGAALTTKARMDSAADAAALSAVKETVSVLQQQQASGGSTNFAAARSAGQAKGNSFFQPTGGTKASQNTTVTQSTTAITATVTYSIDVPTTFGGMFGVMTIPVAGKRVASQNFQTINEYTQIIFLLDISGSMAIGSSDADSQKISNATNGCRFACHDSGVKFPTGCDECLAGVDYYSLIRRNPSIELKLDAAKTAISNLMTYVDAANVTNGYKVSVGINTYATFFNPLLPPTTSASTLKSALAKIDIEDATAVYNYDATHNGFYGGHQGFTYTSQAMTKTLSGLTNVGDGSTSSARKTYVVLVTDGVEDIYNMSAVGERQTGQMFDPDTCNALKANRNIKVITVAAFYPWLTDSPHFSEWIAPIYNSIGPKMQDCASDPNTFYIPASDGNAIKSAASTIFKAIQQSSTGGGPVLTQ